jgi:hypothetical protein
VRSKFLLGEALPRIVTIRGPSSFNHASIERQQFASLLPESQIRSKVKQEQVNH